MGAVQGTLATCCLSARQGVEIRKEKRLMEEVSQEAAPEDVALVDAALEQTASDEAVPGRAPEGANDRSDAPKRAASSADFQCHKTPADDFPSVPPATWALLHDVFEMAVGAEAFGAVEQARVLLERGRAANALFEAAAVPASTTAEEASLSMRSGEAAGIPETSAASVKRLAQVTASVTADADALRDLAVPATTTAEESSLSMKSGEAEGIPETSAASVEERAQVAASVTADADALHDPNAQMREKMARRRSQLEESPKHAGLNAIEPNGTGRGGKQRRGTGKRKGSKELPRLMVGAHVQEDKPDVQVQDNSKVRQGRSSKRTVWD